jgi:hypothetical protein
MALAALTRTCDDSILISKVEYLPTSEIDAAIFESLDVDGQFTGLLGNLSSLFVLPADFRNRVLSMGANDNNQGTLHEFQLSAQCSAKGPSIQAVMRDMKRYRYILRLTSDTGAIIQLGTPAYPASFNYSKSFGEGQANAYSITFSCKTPDNLLYL